MRLGSPDLEKAIRQRVRQELRTSQESWKEYKRMRKAGPRTSWSVAVFPLLPLWFLGWFIRSGRSAEQLLVVLALYSTATVFFRSHSLLRRLYRSHDLAILLHLPIEDALIFRFEWDKFRRASLWLFYVSSLIYGYVALGHLHLLGPWVSFGFVFVASLLQWLTALSLATLLARYRPDWARAKVGLVLDAFVIVTLYVPADLVRQCQTVLLAVPGGWITYAFGKALLTMATHTLPFWGAALFVAALLPFGVVGLRNTYSTKTLAPSRFGIPISAGEVAFEEATPALKEDEFTVAVKRREFLAPVNWKEKGWIERLAADLLHCTQGKKPWLSLCWEDRLVVGAVVGVPEQ